MYQNNFKPGLQTRNKTRFLMNQEMYSKSNIETIVLKVQNSDKRVNLKFNIQYQILVTLITNHLHIEKDQVSVLEKEDTH